MSSGLSKSHRVTSRSPPFFPPSVFAGSFYQLILLTDCPQQFHYRQLACRGEAWSRCKGAAGEQHTGARVPDEARHLRLRTVTFARRSRGGDTSSLMGRHR